MPDNQPTGDDSPGLSLHDLVRTRMREHGWTYSDLERASGRALTRGRWQQLGAGAPPRKFPDPLSLTVIAGVLEVDITTVVLAAARSVGLAVVQQEANLPRVVHDEVPTVVASIPCAPWDAGPPDRADWGGPNDRSDKALAGRLRGGPARDQSQEIDT